MNYDLPLFPHSDTFRSNACHILQRQMHNPPLSRGHGIQRKRLPRSLHPFRRHTRRHAQLFKSQRPVARAVHMNFFMERRLQPQRLERQVFERFQNFRIVRQQNLFVPAVQVRQHFRISLGPSRSRRNRTHTHLQFESGSPHNTLQKILQRLGRCLPVQLAVADKFLSHAAFERIVPSERFRKILAYDFFPRTGFAGAGAGCVRFRYHCCAIPTKLLVRIYTASPLENGKTTNMAAMLMGMNFIIACCCGSVAVTGVIFETRYMDSPIVTGRT